MSFLGKLRRDATSGTYLPRGIRCYLLPGYVGSHSSLSDDTTVRYGSPPRRCDFAIGGGLFTLARLLVYGQCTWPIPEDGSCVALDALPKSSSFSQARIPCACCTVFAYIIKTSRWVVVLRIASVSSK